MRRVQVERVLHVRDLKLLLAGGVVHTKAPLIDHLDRYGFLIGEVIVKTRLCPDTQREVNRIMEEARTSGQVGTLIPSCHHLPDFMDQRRPSHGNKQEGSRRETREGARSREPR